MTVLYRHLTVNLLSVASVLHGHNGQDEVSHAMVLDTFDKENDKLIFKNTHDRGGLSQQFKIQRTHRNAPGELYFVHIEIKDMDNLPSQEEREATMEAKIKERKAKIEALREAEKKKRKETLKRKANEDAKMVEAKRMQN